MAYLNVCHDVPAELAGADAPFTFVTSGVESSIAPARAAADGDSPAFRERSARYGSGDVGRVFLLFLVYVLA